MSYTESDLIRLKRMQASGVLRVTENGRTIEYRSMADLERAISAVEAELGTSGAQQIVCSTLSAERI